MKQESTVGRIEEGERERERERRREREGERQPDLSPENYQGATLHV